MGGFTVKMKLLDWTPFNDAVMFVEPFPCAVACPVPLMVATPVLEEFQVTWLVMSAVEPPLYVPVAVHCAVPSLAIDVGEQVMEISVSDSIGVTGFETPEAAPVPTVFVADTAQV